MINSILSLVFFLVIFIMLSVCTNSNQPGNHETYALVANEDDQDPTPQF
jgi:hypothetical protein